ncbi:hypothetical protein N665_1223s0021 [Sinapis alba]|nr:hypothetical protein N665_1223s0021 [Sinapis alba]
MGTCFSSSSSTSRTSHIILNYVNNLHLREALASSLVSSMEDINHHPQPQRHEEEPEIKTENKPAEPSSRLCMICMDEKSSSDMFRGNCTHSDCTECTVRYMETKDRRKQPTTCRDMIPKNMFERWDKALCESLFMLSEKVYCPFENCSAMMVVEGDDKVTATECPSCHRLFCAQCKVTWHEGIGCNELQRVGNTKKKCRVIFKGILNLAKKKQWRRCRCCKVFVEKLVGCRHISCRCGFEFCYDCGLKWGYPHFCPKLILKFRRPFTIY